MNRNVELKKQWILWEALNYSHITDAYWLSFLAVRWIFLLYHDGHFAVQQGSEAYLKKIKFILHAAIDKVHPAWTFSEGLRHMHTQHIKAQRREEHEWSALSNV